MLQYEQLHGASMRDSLGLVLADIMTKCKKIIIDKYIEVSVIKFYVRYIDNTLPVSKRSDIASVQNKLQH